MLAVLRLRVVTNSMVIGLLQPSTVAQSWQVYAPFVWFLAANRQCEDSHWARARDYPDRQPRH